jgi:predicted transcriptional regulator
LSIKPEFAAAIVRGEKQFEFRRCIFRRQVTVVVIYITAPIKCVIGEFDVKSIITEHPITLWRITHKAAGIDKRRFLQYFEGVDRGYAIEVGEVRLYEEPLQLATHFGIKPPQSFLYLDFDWPRMSPTAQ